MPGGVLKTFTNAERRALCPGIDWGSRWRFFRELNVIFSGWRDGRPGLRKWRRFSACRRAPQSTHSFFAWSGRPKVDNLPIGCIDTRRILESDRRSAMIMLPISDVHQVERDPIGTPTTSQLRCFLSSLDAQASLADLQMGFTWPITLEGIGLDFRAGRRKPPHRPHRGLPLTMDTYRITISHGHCLRRHGMTATVFLVYGSS